MKHMRNTPGHHARGFTLIEVLLSIFILGIGIVSIATLFPAGIVQQRRSNDDVMGPIVANNALGIIRSRLSQEDFGTLEDHVDAANAGLWSEPLQRAWAHQFYTTFGDWPWIRPGVILVDDPGTDRNEQGLIDLFNLDPNTLSTPNDTFSEFGSGDPLRGVPFNTSRFNIGGLGERAPVIGHAERFFPMAPVNGRVLDSSDRPQYMWDCMFRRFQGRVQVAIFVYRITAPAGENFLYRPDDHTEVMPLRRSFVSSLDIVNGNFPWTDAWDVIGVDCGDGTIAATVPNTCPGDTLDLNDPYDTWQTGEQWLLDQNGNIHRVLAGRSSEDEGPVELQREIPAMANTGVYFFDPVPDNGVNAAGAQNVVSDIWFIPSTLPVDLDGDGNDDDRITLTPVYVAVKEL